MQHVSNLRMTGSDEFPQDIGENDCALGLQRIEIAQPGCLGFSTETCSVVARVLCPSDLLVKIFESKGGAKYSYRRWGYSKTNGSPNELDWHPMSVPMSFDKAATFIQEYDFKEHESTAAFAYGDIVGVPFDYQEPIG
jgi:hypothetical protein